MSEQTTLKRSEAESLLAWWRDAGVDTLIDERPRNWLEAVAAEPPTVQQSIAAADPMTAFETVDRLVAWLMSDTDQPELGPVARRVRPAGDAGADLMILADVPEAGDVDAGRLLTGEAGVLLDRMLAALDLTRDAAYLASVAPARPAGGRLDDPATDRLATLAKRHVALAAPARLWLMGRAASRAVLGIDEAAAVGKLHHVKLDGLSIRTIATAHPRVLLREPGLKKRVWTDMQRLLEGSSE